jgi:diguanylate cyclase (GGDEF)-like protein
MYCLPLLNRQSACIGVLQLLNRTRVLSTEDRQFLDYMAIELASALEHAWSHYRLEKKHEQESKRSAELSKINHKLRDLVFQDPLTGLKNHRYLQDALDRELARSERHHKPCALVVCDVDHFKRINDTYGHQSGDVVLTRIGSALRTTTRRYDTVARYGGEEFAIVLPETTGPQAMRKAQRCREEVESLRIRVNGAVIRATISVGVSVFTPLRPIAKAALIELADVALYASKGKGRNCVTMATDR